MKAESPKWWEAMTATAVMLTLIGTGMILAILLDEEPEHIPNWNTGASKGAECGCTCVEEEKP